MAYLMSDVAAGSSAALQLQQNMAAAPDVQQQQAMAVQQQQANLERTKLANLVADTGIKADQESRQKLSALTQSPEFKAADDAKKLQMISSTQFEMGKVEEGAKTLTASELYTAKEVANKQKQLDVQAQQIGNAFGVISAVPDDKVQEFVDRLPEENKKALISQIGQENWDKMNGAEKKEATKNLMLNAKGQMAKQMKEIELEKAAMNNEIKVKIAEIQATARIQAKLAGGTDHQMKDWNSYQIRQQAIEKSGQKTLESLDKAVEDAQGKLDKTFWFNPAGKEKEALQRAINKRDEFQRGQIQKELDLVTSAPQFPGRDTIIDNLKKQLELYPAPAATGSKDKPAGTPAPAAAKTDVPSNKPEDALKVEAGQPALPKKTPQQYAAEVNKDKEYTPDQKKAFIDRYTNGYNQIKKQEDALTTKAKADPSMKDNKFGRYIDGKGVEVFDSKGKLIGHYN